MTIEQKLLEAFDKDFPYIFWDCRDDVEDTVLRDKVREFLTSAMQQVRESEMRSWIFLTEGRREARAKMELQKLQCKNNAVNL